MKPSFIFYMKKIIPFLIILIFAACSSDDQKVIIPENILSKEKMATVMVDVHLLEAALNIRTFSRDQVAMNTINPNSNILKKNNITKKQYDDSFEFYSKHPLLFSEVYQLVLNNLSKLQAEIVTKK